MSARSEALFDRAAGLIPGGVNSPVRAFGAVGGTPPFIAHARGATVTDVDGNEYLDFIGSWGPLILGHAHPAVVRAVSDAAKCGTSYGLPCPGEVELAQRVVAANPHVEQVRFVSSGTEAVMSAVRLARGVTGRDLVIKFSGCYHGHADHLLVQAGSGLVTLGTPSSAGVPQAFSSKTLVAPLDDGSAVSALFDAHADQIAAVLIEPVPANNGLLLQRVEYLGHLRACTQGHGALLIFDEVISGFRLGPGGAAAHYGITPDLVTYGKVIGGGMPVGAFGGRRDVMQALAPLGAVYQAGTLSGNPVAMAAGCATLDALYAADGWAQLEALGAHLEGYAGEKLSALGVRLVRLGSIFWLSLADGAPPRRADQIADAAPARYRTLFHALRARGILLAPSAYEVGFLSLAHTPEDVERLVDALAETIPPGETS